MALVAVDWVQQLLQLQEQPILAAVAAVLVKQVQTQEDQVVQVL